MTDKEWKDRERWVIKGDHHFYEMESTGGVNRLLTVLIKWCATQKGKMFHFVIYGWESASDIKAVVTTSPVFLLKIFQETHGYCVVCREYEDAMAKEKTEKDIGELEF